jgi:hypothetical protein
LALAISKASSPPVTIEPDDDADPDNVAYTSHWPKRPPSLAAPQIDLDVITPPSSLKVSRTRIG